MGRGAATAAWSSPGLCVPICAPLAAVQGRSRPSIGVDRAWLTCAFVRGRTTTNPAPGHCQLHGLSRLPSRPTDHERPPDMAMVDGDQAANAWCHDGGLRSAFRVIRDGSLRTAHAADLRERTLTNLRGPLPAALAVWGSGVRVPSAPPGVLLRWVGAPGPCARSRRLASRSRGPQPEPERDLG